MIGKIGGPTRTRARTPEQIPPIIRIFRRNKKGFKPWQIVTGCLDCSRLGERRNRSPLRASTVKAVTKPRKTAVFDALRLERVIYRLNGKRRYTGKTGGKTGRYETPQETNPKRSAVPVTSTVPTSTSGRPCSDDTRPTVRRVNFPPNFSFFPVEVYLL